MTSNTVLITCFSLILLTGCVTSGTSKGNVWPAPPRPQMKSVVITQVSESKVEPTGFYMSSTSASNLASNVEEMKAYIKKLEVLVWDMSKCYGDKIEEKK